MRPQLHRRRRIALDDLLVDQLTRQTAQASEMAALRTDGKALVCQCFEVCGQCAGVELRGLESGIAAPRLKQTEVVRVCLHRMAAQPALDRLAREMSINQLVPAGGAHAGAPARGFCSTFSSNAARSSRMRSRSSIFSPPARSLT